MPWVMVMVTAMASSRKGGGPEPGKLLDLGQQLQLIAVCFCRCFRRPRPAASFLLRFDFRDDCICMVGLDVWSRLAVPFCKAAALQLLCRRL